MLQTSLSYSISEQLRVVSLSGAKQRSASCIGTKCTWYHNSMGESAFTIS